jgi:hypothetical protein
VKGFDSVSEELVRIEENPEELRAHFDEALLHEWAATGGFTGDAATYAIARHFYELGRQETKT